MARMYVLEKRGADYRVIEIGDFLARAVVHFRDDRELTCQALISETRRIQKAKGYESLTPEQKKLVFAVPLLD